MIGTVTSYLSDKNYGFIKGEDGKDYFFHDSSLKDKKDINKLCEDLILEFKKIHGDKYDYDKVNYINSKTKVEIICSEHGSFLQRPMDHKNGTGCPECGKLKAVRVKNNIIEDFVKIHKDTYDYSKVQYINNRTNVEIICKKHGSFFQRPLSHRAGSGCPNCKISKGKWSRIFTWRSF